VNVQRITLTALSMRDRNKQSVQMSINALAYLATLS
jgi:hypothetical protein